jgi:hypothetical protein
MSWYLALVLHVYFAMIILKQSKQSKIRVNLMISYLFLIDDAFEDDLAAPEIYKCEHVK